jgi:FMN phosphatase YigB (HAD superfamily)
MTAIKAVIWDLDNTLYRFTDALKENCNIAAAKAAQSLGIAHSFEECLSLAKVSELQHGYSLHVFTQQHGFAYADLHHPFHDAIEEKLIEPVPDIKNLLKKTGQPHAIVTNASRNWADKVLAILELGDFFAPSHIIPMEDVNFEPKARSPRSLLKAANILGVEMCNILLVDDMVRNLTTGKQLGMRTALVNSQEHHTDAVDYKFDRVENVFTLL